MESTDPPPLPSPLPQNKRKKSKRPPDAPKRTYPPPSSSPSPPTLTPDRTAPPPLLPYPAYPAMNPPYNPGPGGPYAHYPQPPSAGPPPHVGQIPAHPTAPQYAAYLPHNPYPHPYSYPPYVQSQGILAYPPQRPPSQEDVTPPDQPPSSASASKSGRKRKGSDRRGTGDRTSEDEADVKKRTKTQRACDSCRSRKIRCDVLTDADPPVCQHCKQYGFDCTFFLPITETRFKKKRLEEEAAAAAEKDKEERDRTSSPRERDVRIYGPTSPAHLLHSQVNLSSHIYESYDTRYHHKWEVSGTGDGLIQIHDPPTPEDPHPAPPKPLDLRIERDVIEKLINAYFNEVAPNMPVVTRTEFLANQQPPPVLLYSMCLVAAARREVPQSVFDSVRYAVNGLIKGEEVLSTASIVNVQALLILCMLADCHSAHVPQALSALWIRLGSAIRMAQDLGLHRAESVKRDIELRRRLWGICVISDRWTSLAYGHPYMIDVQDCDARLPSSGDPNDVYMDELMRLSILLGRVLKTVYSPSGLMLATDEILQSLLDDIEAWKANLPPNLQYRGIDGNRQAGLLHLLYSCVLMIFWRVFMRISYSCPEHLKFSLTVEHWSNLIRLTGEAIDWLDSHEQMYDVWLLVAYASTSCALVQYHTWARRKDANAAAKLRQLRDCVRRWESSLSPDHMSARRKTAEIITLLYEATQGPPSDLTAAPLNPTGGVVNKQPLGGLEYKKDPSRPGGGVYVAHGTSKRELADLPPGTVVASSDGEDSEAARQAQVRTQQDSTMAEVQEAGTNGAVAGPSSNGNANNSLVNITPLGGGGFGPNVNPAMNPGIGQTGNSVQVLNVLNADVPTENQTATSMSLEQFAMADTGFLEGLPGGMFDWGQWDNFFSRFAGTGVDGQAQGMPAGFPGSGPQQPTPEASTTSGATPPNLRKGSSGHAQPEPGLQ